MDTKNILADLKAELNRLNQAIAALESLDGTATATTPAAIAAPKPSKRRGLTPAGRRRLSAMMKARWAARRKAVQALLIRSALHVEDPRLGLIDALQRIFDVK